MRFTTTILSASLLLSFALMPQDVQAQPQPTSGNIPRKLHYRRDSEIRRRIEAALDTRVTEDLAAAGSLDEYARMLGKAFDIPVFLDDPAFSSEGITRDMPPRLVVGHCVRDSFLCFTPENRPPLSNAAVSLYLTIEHDTLIISTKTKSDEVFEAAIYDLRGLPADLRNDPLKAAGIVRNQTSGLWIEDGLGEGSAVPFAGGLAVRQTQEVHREILSLLEKLQEFNSTPPTPLTKPVAIPPLKPREKSPQRLKYDALLQQPWTPELAAARRVGDLANRLRDELDFPVCLDELSLAAEGVCPRTDINVIPVVEGTSIQDALGLLLGDVSGVPLRAVFHHDALYITTVPKKEEFLTTEVYGLRWLRGQLAEEPQYVQDIVVSCTSGFWINGGPELDGITMFEGGMLIRQTDHVQDQIEDLLLQLHEFQQQPGYPEPKPIERPLPPKAGFF